MTSYLLATEENTERTRSVFSVLDTFSNPKSTFGSLLGFDPESGRIPGVGGLLITVLYLTRAIPGAARHRNAARRSPLPEADETFAQVACLLS